MSFSFLVHDILDVSRQTNLTSNLFLANLKSLRVVRYTEILLAKITLDICTLYVKIILQKIGCVWQKHTIFLKKQKTSKIIQ